MNSKLELTQDFILITDNTSWTERYSNQENMLVVSLSPQVSFELEIKGFLVMPFSSFLDHQITDGDALFERYANQCLIRFGTPKGDPESRLTSSFFASEIVKHFSLVLMLEEALHNLRKRCQTKRILTCVQNDPVLSFNIERLVSDND